MEFAKQSENEFEQYGAAVGIAISNGLHEESIDMAFTRGGGIAVQERAEGTSLPLRAALDANAVGGIDSTLTFNHGEAHELLGIDISSDGVNGSVDVARSDNRVTRISADKDGNGQADLSLSYKYGENNVLTAIEIDENNDGKVDAILSPDRSNEADKPVRGFNVDLGADGTADAYAEFIRNDKNEVTSIRFRNHPLG